MGKKSKNDDEEEEKVIIYIDVRGTKLPLNAVRTIKESIEYNYDHNKTDYYIIINEQHDGILTVYSNIKIKCITELHMLNIISRIEDQMKDNKREFIKI